MSPLHVLASSVKSLGNALVASRVNATPASAIKIRPTNHLVSFDFIRADDDTGEQLSLTVLAKHTDKMSDVSHSAWDRDITLPTGVFAHIPQQMIQEISRGECDMMFLLPKLDKLHRNALGKQNASDIIEAVGDEPRPIPIVITFEKARKKAATTSMSLNLFR
jgi:hypothetical protein